MINITVTPMLRIAAKIVTTLQWETKMGKGCQKFLQMILFLTILFIEKTQDGLRQTNCKTCKPSRKNSKPCNNFYDMPASFTFNL